MPTNREYDGWVWAPVRLVVWVLAFVYLGRVQYNNSLWDLRRLSTRYVVVRTITLGIVGAFAYWNLFVVPPAVQAYMWTVVAVMYTAVLVVKFVVDAGAATHRITPRRESPYHGGGPSLVEPDRRVAGKELGDVPRRDPRDVGDD